jgi:hypothetical protein
MRVMPFRYFLLLFLFLVSFQLAAQDKYPVETGYQGLSFRAFSERMEKQYHVRFFYRDEWISDLKLGDYPACTDLSCILDHLLSGTTLYYLIEDNGHIVLTQNYAVKMSAMPSRSENFIPPGLADAENRKLSENGAVEIGNPTDKGKAGNVILSGYVTDTETREPLPGVTVYIAKAGIGTMSNEYGYYALTAPRGSHLLQFSSIGMKEKQLRISLNSAGELNMSMNTMIIPLKEVVVTAEKSVTMQRFEVGAEKMSMASFKLLPSPMGEADILKSVLLIPGVQSVGEGAAGFNVRGGSADQNLILLNGAPVYNSSHFFGFFSAVNADIIRDVTLYKGGIPSRFGGRISSVLDIGGKEGNRNKFNGNAGISPITTHLTLEGPLIRDTLTYIVAARTTYSNWIFGMIDDPALNQSRANFYDVNGAIAWDPNKKNKISISGYLSHDAFRFNADTVYDYSNKIATLKWRHFFNSRFFSAFSLNHSSYAYKIAGREVPEEAFVLAHQVNSTGMKADFNWFAGKHEVNFGLEVQRHGVNPGSYLPDADSSRVEPRTLEKERALESALYLEDHFTLSKSLSLSGGIRMSSFLAFGPQTVLQYNPAFSRSASSVTDTVTYGRGATMAKYAGPEFRLSLNYLISAGSSLKVNYNRTRQYMHLLSNSTSISPTDAWKLSDAWLKPQIGDQVALGYYRNMFRSRFEFSGEVYYKSIRNMVDYKGGTDLIMNATLEQDLVPVIGKAYGLELVLKKTEGKSRYSIGYTYARTFVKSTGTFKEEIINGGKWFPASFDKPNDLVLTFSYLFSRRFSFSSNYTWSTGRPITFPVATYVMYNNVLVHYSDRNRYRIPDYSRLDVSFRLNGNLKSKRIGHPAWTFSVYNLLGRENVYSIYFKKEGDVVKGYKLSVFGRAIPSLTFSFDF